MDNVNICRACLTAGEPMLSLFELYEHDLSLAVILQSCLATEVYEGDNLPPHLCDKCIQVLTQFYNFTIIYEQSDQHLRSLLSTDLKNEPKKEVQEDVEKKSILDSGLKLDAKLKKPIIQYNENSNDTEDNADAEDDYQYYEVKDSEPFDVDAQNTVGYLNLNCIKSENFDGEICNLYSVQEINEDNKRIVQSNILCNSENKSFEEILKYECTLCGEEHLYLTAFRNHMRTKHAIFHVNPAEFSSTIQVKILESEPIVNQLTQAHEDILCGAPTLECSICNKKFHFPAQLNKHVKVHQMGKKFICEVCGAGFIRKTYLDDHKEGHSTERKHACPFCNKKFRRRTVLRAHKRSHTHRNHYVCELCGRAFTGKGTLRTHHLLIHVRERNFKCMICHQKFPLKSTLNKHVLRHEKREKGEKGFNCTECDMEYRDKSSLKRHIEVKHLGHVILVQCPDCPKEYTSNANLAKHRKRHHPNELDD